MTVYRLPAVVAGRDCEGPARESGRASAESHSPASAMVLLGAVQRREALIARILGALRAHTLPRSVGAIARQLHEGPAGIERLLRSMRLDGLVHRTESGRWSALPQDVTSNEVHAWLEEQWEPVTTADLDAEFGCGRKKAAKRFATLQRQRRAISVGKGTRGYRLWVAT